MSRTVRCPFCRAKLPVKAWDLGRPLTCPACAGNFDADDEQRPPGYEPPADGLTPSLVGLALLPFGIPLLWLLGPPLTGKVPIFSFAAPVAVAVGLAGLGVGIGLATGWGHAARVRGILALSLVGYFTAGGLYFLKKEWAEAIRRDLNPGPANWTAMTPPGTRLEVLMPGRAVKSDVSPLPGWPLTAYRSIPPGRQKADQWTIRYEIAHGPPPPGLKDGDWFAAAREAVLKAAEGAELIGEQTVKDGVVGEAKCEGREFRLTLADGATNRFVRVFRHRTKPLVYYLAVEGAFLPAGAEYVNKFFESFRPDPL
jgi:hypothetical protein